MRVLLLSAYDAASHRAWREGLVAALPAHHWRVLALPPRHFAWRSRGSALSWALGEQTTLETPLDLLVSTAMTDLSALRGLAPALCRVPTLVYFHENQFAYPPGPTQRQSPAFIQSLNLYTALAGDRLVFNSAHNRDSFLEGVAGFLRRMPDAVPPGVVERLRGRAGVLPVPLDDTCFAPPRGPDLGAPPLILWNHRWEYDKAPERCFAALATLAAEGVGFRLAVLGQSFRRVPAVFGEIREKLAARIVAWGHQSRADYLGWLRRADVVVSSALHDFQGLAVLEAVAAGAIPVVPARLAYPEFLPADCCYPGYPDDPDREAAALAARLRMVLADLPGWRARCPDLGWLGWNRLAPAYRTLLAEVVGRES